MVKNSTSGVQKIQKEGSSKAKAMPSSMSSSISTAAANKKKYKGVRMRSWGSWVSEIRAPNQKTRIWLGSYSTAEAAARAYDAALLCLKGSSANLNFPNTASTSLNIPQDTLLSPKSIQRVAAAAANCFLDNVPAPSSPPPLDNVNPSSYSSPSPSSSFVSSPSMSASSPSDQLLDDDVSMMGSIGSHDGNTTGCYDHDPHQYHQLGNIELPMPMMESSWYNFDSLEYQWPKYVDQMLNGDLFGPPLPPVLDDLYEETDIRLWSFC
ncbi:hypothetical protein FNV43_RR10856 [Rhamnella rubrinervis]|uniref:AP2/ERF domain-containing protein n=1 Tax=Rhamnella rubrinervis TaxID=2594499 RepID=A0A8K0H554_9ROSA|nr:hypothetical protein FNV43_RR10856 [Rhamnella rubrinervis]